MEFFTGYESFMGVNFFTTIATLCNLLIVYFLMKKFLFKPVKNMIDSRQKEIDDLYADATESREAAALLKNQYEERLTTASAESEEILRQAHRRAQVKEEEILRKAQEQAAQTLKHADEQIALEKKQAMNDMKDQVSDLAVDIASAVLARDIEGGEHTELIDSFIDRLGEGND